MLEMDCMVIRQERKHVAGEGEELSCACARTGDADTQARVSLMSKTTAHAWKEEAKFSPFALP